MRNYVEDLVCVYARKLPSLEPLLTAWTRAVLRYCSIERHTDNPWWFNERASLSTLAGAAWTLDDWAALEEFNTRKRGGIVPKDRTDDGSRHGRCDLYISKKRGHCYAIEAKQAWQSIGNGDDGSNTFHMMQAAWDDVGRLSREEADRRLAVTFVIPFLLKTVAAKQQTREVIEEWLDGQTFSNGKRSPDAYAWVFPAKSEDYVNRKSGRVFPGVVMLVEERVRGNRRTRER